MKIAITGHTKGIGKAITDYLQDQGHEVLGYSRSNGFDISSEHVRNFIVEQLKYCDVFINNAFALSAQKDLLLKSINLWRDTDNIIINMNSKSILMPTVPEYMKDYVDDKLQQQQIIKDRIFKARPYIINFTVGLVDTDMSKVFNSKKINPTDLAKLICNLLEFKGSLAVQDILVEVPDLNWDNIERI